MCSKPDQEFWNQSDTQFAGATEATKDNQEVAWPALKRELDQNLPESANPARVLDFGCGAGQLAHLLAARGESQFSAEEYHGGVR